MVLLDPGVNTLRISVNPANLDDGNDGLTPPTSPGHCR